MKPLQYRLVSMLSDGDFHSGAEMGEYAGVSRATIWKALRKLEMLGLGVFAVRGRGYRLAQPLELLSQQGIAAGLTPAISARIGQIEILDEVDSTNSHLLLHRAATNGYRVCLAERQLSGRGRRGRRWSSPFARNIYLSMMWLDQRGGADISLLPLVLGAAVLQALKGYGIAGLGVKWPNDILVDGRKLGGLLLEMAGEGGGAYRMVAGVGINVDMPASSAADIDQPWTDLQRCCGQPVSRNHLVAELVTVMVAAIEDLASGNAAAWLADWSSNDVLMGHEVEIDTVHGLYHGIAAGIDAKGALLVQVGNELRRFYSGDVSLRAVAPMTGGRV
ncbi:MAG: bifunctional biotin--[acetyl-CoA-carboxylase] ligase/biotin operon repressor BirA [Gammaproteobacteria bacterium]|nr:bifunctional biotin--[acetyl-CoA-carboxylase] ligase/biotin operon repressor BirA [Gammaproteobacteria bacterium]